MRRFEVLVCDDNAAACQNLVHRIQELQLNVKGFTKEQDLAEYVRWTPGQYVILLDIMFEERDVGIELARELLKINPDCQIVFISSFLEKACDVYEVDHCYFIHKPQLEERLEAALDKAILRLKLSRTRLVVHEKNNPLQLCLEEVVFIQRVNRYSMIHTQKETYQVRESFEQLEERLPVSFCQCHRSYMLNFAHAVEFRSREVEMSDGSVVPVSRPYIIPVREAFSAYAAGELL